MSARNIAWLLFFAAITVGLIVVMSIYLPAGKDWERTFRPAAVELLAGRNPYDRTGLKNPVWLLLPILPLAVLPSNIGRSAFLLMSLAGFAYAAYRLKARPASMAAFLASPVVLHCLLNANVDWIPILGFVLPPQIGLFFVVTKPQVGLGVAVFWFVEAWRQGGWQQVLKIFWPVTLATGVMFLVFGFWPTRFADTADYWWNASLWPYTIPVGLGLLAGALRTRNMRYAMGAAPCLSPFLTFHSWSAALIAIIANPFETILVVVGLWIVVVLRSIA